MAVIPWRIDMATDNSSQAPEGGEDPRLGSLEDRLEAAHRAEAERTAPSGVTTGSAFTGKGASQGNRVLSTLIGTPLGATIIGWLLDRWFGTAPAAMLAMLFLGIITAFVQIWRISRERAE
jgi:ATP synthase protein I